eukprot:symbB.v1.2.022866.t1/scaffold2036.1/size91645/4
MRGLTAMKATREVVQKSVVAVEAWIVVFLPFVADMWRKGRALWHVLSFRTKVVLVAGPVGLYLFCLAVKRLLDAFHRNRAAMKRTLWAVLFHGSFLLACPVLWYVSGCISPKWQHLCLKHFLTTVPTLGSLFALGWRPAPQIAELLALEVIGKLIVSSLCSGQAFALALGGPGFSSPQARLRWWPEWWNGSNLFG